MTEVCATTCDRCGKDCRSEKEGAELRLVPRPHYTPVRWDVCAECLGLLHAALRTFMVWRANRR